MSKTPHLGIQHVEPAQANKEAVFNAAIDAMDGGLNAVKDIPITAATLQLTQEQLLGAGTIRLTGSMSMPFEVFLPAGKHRRLGVLNEAGAAARVGYAATADRVEVGSSASAEVGGNGDTQKVYTLSGGAGAIRIRDQLDAAVGNVLPGQHLTWNASLQVWQGDWAKLRELSDVVFQGNLSQGMTIEYHAETGTWREVVPTLPWLHDVRVTGDDAPLDGHFLTWSAERSVFRPGVAWLYRLGDVQLTNLQTSQILVYTGSGWENRTPTLDLHDDVQTTGEFAPKDRDTLLYGLGDGQWRPGTPELSWLKDVSDEPSADGLHLTWNSVTKQWAGAKAYLSRAADVQLSASPADKAALIYSEALQKWQDGKLPLNWCTDVSKAPAPQGSVLQMKEGLLTPTLIRIRDLADAQDIEPAEKNALIYKNGLYRPLPLTTRMLSDFQDVTPLDGQTVRWNDTLKLFEPTDLPAGGEGGDTTIISGNGAAMWCNFDGRPSTFGLRAGYNVSSVTRVGQGEYIVYFTHSLGHVNFAATYGGRFDDLLNVSDWTMALVAEPRGNVAGGSRGANFIRVRTSWHNGTSAFDLMTVCIAVFA